MDKQDLKRYSVQTRLGEIGIEGQHKLASSKVMIVGCGALGSVIAMYLAGAGVGNLILADFDTVDISNLQRQVFYKEDETGCSKAEITARNVRELNSQIDVKVMLAAITSRKLDSMESVPDLIIDAADNPATTYLLEKYCEQRGIAFSTAGVSGWRAQILSYIPGKTKFSDIFPPVEESDGVLPCSIAGVFGPLTGLVGSLQASETIKMLLDIGQPLTDTLLTIDLLTNTFTKIKI